jgi:uncharacterized protein YfaS (alpha-2-macroglobulin family)
MVLTSVAAPADPEALLKAGDEQFEKKNYRDAAGRYEALLAAEPKHEKWIHASERLIICKLRLRLFDDALAEAEKYIKRAEKTPYEARAERLTGNLYMLLPHWGTRAGGVFYRGEYKQGIRLRSEQHDKKHAVTHLERARALYAQWDDPAKLAALPEAERAGWHDERIECIFDLANVCSRFGIYENNWQYWYSFWGERDDTLAETAGEEDFDEYYSHWQWRRKRPIGLRVDAEGRPIFPTRPDEYAAGLPDDGKILFLLNEARELDRTENRRHEALGWYRQAMLARARFGMDRLNGYAGLYYSGGSHPLQEELEDFNPWELADKEALVLAGGKIRKVDLPKDWDVLSMLRLVSGDFQKSGVADQAQYGIGLYHQSRQQYKTALKEYEDLGKRFGDSKWAASGREQRGRILASQVRVSDTNVQLAGKPAELQASYRNTSKLWFVARRIDHEGFMKFLRNEAFDENKRPRGWWALGNWSNYFVHEYHHRDWVQNQAVRYIGGEVARWSDEVKDDGTHRYAQVTLQTPLDKPGAYLVYCYLSEPPKEDAEKTGRECLKLGSSRAVFALSDVAFVQKRSKEGNLYWVTHAETGAPLPEANVDIVEVWSTYDRQKRKSEYHRAEYHLLTDKDGLAVLPYTKHGGNLHVLVKAGEGRLAWSGMQYSSRYSPSRMRDGRFAYCITDRPVYRPGQTVRYKVWLRRMVMGNYKNAAGERVSITVYDPRGNKVTELTKQADNFGGLDGDFVLGEEPPLGVYRLYVKQASYLGGQNFRVEEYKKPEFEVSVEPGKDHVKLGDKVTALVKAKYYFGAPVTDATVSYKVFREEYRQAYYPPGPWDWLYGPGYGLPWYEYSWFPWWAKVRCCWVPPGWWWGCIGVQPQNPVRELVQQGKGPIGPDGTLKVEIDTAPALKAHGDLDHRYIVEAEVRDASRRVITGEGAVKVTRQAYYAYVTSDRGYYRPNEEMVITVRCLTPGGKPVKTGGLVTVSSVVFGGPDNARIEETELKRWEAATDENGELQFRMRYEKSGQLKIKFEAPDAWGGKVEGYGLVWYCGRDFEGQLYRFNDLQLILDKRTYEPGETAHVMICTKRAGGYVLYSDDVDNNALLSYKVLHLPQKYVVVDIPVTKDQRPNFFVEATTISDLKVHQQSLNICVPPAEGVMKLSVETDKPSYKPGEKATVKVQTASLEGKPVQAQVALSWFDKSVLYIQPEMTPDIAKWFHGRMKYHNVWMTTNLYDRMGAWGYVHRPFQQLHPYPEAWFGTWGPTVGDWRTVGDEELANLRGGRELQSGFAGAEQERAAAAPGAPAAMDAAKAAAPEEKGDRRALRKNGAGEGEGAGEAGYAEAEVRQAFADTALWLPSVVTDADGTATVSCEMPENLTTWKLNAWGMTQDTRVGESSTEAVTTKNLLVRLQAPRFFLEYDEVVISANVHNYLESAKKARVSLDVPEELLKMIGETPATLDVEVPAGGEKRVDWRVKVVKEGTAKITVKALTDEESDAMLMTFPVLVHGMTKQVATTGSMRPDETEKTLTVELNVPDKRRPELTRLEVQYSPSLIGAMLDALPYCLYYPYGCSEQTMSRFVPAVLTLKTLQNMGMTLEDIRKVRGRMDEIRRIEKGEHRKIYVDSPIFDQGELDRIIEKSVGRIEAMQNGDGGWGWWKGNESSGYMTSYVLWSLVTAEACDVKLREGMIDRGMNFLKGWEERELREDHWSVHAQHAYVAYVLSLRKLKAEIKPGKEDKRDGRLIERLWTGRDKLTLYGKALLAMAMANLDDARAKTVLENIMQYKEENAETEVAWFRTPQGGWWYWWNNDIETNAMVLRAIVRLEPKSDVAPKLVKWLLNNRRNGYYWRSTRDTTMCVAAMSDFVVASGEGRPDYTLTLDFDGGAVVKKVKINKDNFFTYDNRFLLEGVTLGGGKHTLKITKEGPGALYVNTYLSYFTKEEFITAAGHELHVERTYYKLEQIPFEVEVEGAEGQKLMEKRLRYERVPVKTGEMLKSGDVVQVELRVKSDNDYTYLVLEDMKHAGCEPLEVRSGGKGQEGFWSYMELRDEKVCFFMNMIGQGEHLLRYRVRAEIPGLFHALPTRLYAMYVPELKANSDEHVLKIIDQP